MNFSFVAIMNHIDPSSTLEPDSYIETFDVVSELLKRAMNLHLPSRSIAFYRNIKF